MRSFCSPCGKFFRVTTVFCAPPASCAARTLRQITSARFNCYRHYRRHHTPIGTSLARRQKAILQKEVT